jgi:hypothetical protein
MTAKELAEMPVHPTPCCETCGHTHGIYDGVTVRMWLAGKAMAALVSADGLSGIREAVTNGQARGPRWHDPDNVADAAVDLADALIARLAQVETAR